MRLVSGWIAGGSRMVAPPAGGHGRRRSAVARTPRSKIVVVRFPEWNPAA